MKKSVYGRKLGRNSNQRKALFRSLISCLIEKGKVRTTLAKAKAVKGQAERLITKAKKGSLNDRRIILRFLNKKSLVDRLVDGITPNLAERHSGYLKILKLERRKGDDAVMALLSFVDELPVIEKPEKKVIKKVAEGKKVAEAKK
ncbi:50S ribosomal protein L17 [Candidatus Shapirobacteria bacterium CG07_land_8_20_14_0_80_39_18]|uniref:50S ribosomal protein L17 n=1 Tax=Candidatus Shapirobacteria bacterium CG07_land_8_20_14_0_80_39_18 TaxID=1974882 RepID=A0A2M6YRN0_9BACT|nr:MAG: 50S ribosomal protein L17 [Candidatus Shapirobacteria bacterium CG07_land_8_20_14_0_80_39_18]